MEQKEFYFAPLADKEIEDLEYSISLLARYFKVHPYTIRRKLEDLFQEQINELEGK